MNICNGQIQTKKTKIKFCDGGNAEKVKRDLINLLVHASGVAGFLAFGYRIL